MNKNDLTILLTAILLACFFLPVVQWDSYEMSGMNFILSDHTPDTKYLSLIGPVSTFILLLGAIYRERYVTNRNILRILPFLSVIVLFVICFNENPGGSSFSNMNIGAWIAFIASFVLVVIKPEREHSSGYSN